MKIYLLRATKKNAFLMVDGKNLAVPNNDVDLMGISKNVFGLYGRIVPNDENSFVNEYFVQYRIGIPMLQNEEKYDDGRIIQFIHKIPYEEFLSQKQDYVEGKNCWTPSLKVLHRGWITPF